MPDEWFTKVLGHPVVRIWSYRSTLFVFLTLFLGFSSVVPIDSISQASQSDNNYALNTFVVVGALVLFGITATVLITTRVYMLRVSMADIPKRYLPIEPHDLPKGCSEMIQENTAQCEEIRALALQTPKEVKHPGISGPDSELLPPLLPFDDAVRSIGLKLKWDRNFINSDIVLPKNLSFRESIAYIESKHVSIDAELCREYVELYEELRYSGKLITEDQFVEFMELSVSVMKEIATSGEPSSENGLKYTGSLFSRYSDNRSRSYSLRHRTNSRSQHLSNSDTQPQQPQGSGLERSNTQGYYGDPRQDLSDAKSLVGSIKRTTTEQSLTSVRTSSTTNYNPYY